MRFSRLSVLGRRQRFFVFAAILLSGVGAALPAADSEGEPAAVVTAAKDAEAAVPDFSHVYVQWREKNDFKRIAEYFSGDEYTGGDLVLRSEPGVRRGLYFRISVPGEIEFPKNSTAVIEYIRGDSPVILTQVYTLPECPTGWFSEVKLGLTGKDWPENKISLVAWRITLKDPSGKALARRQSFLWGMPKKSAGE